MTRRLALTVGAALGATLLAGCGGSGPAGPQPTVTVQVVIADGEVQVDQVRTQVDRDSVVTLEVTSDAPAEVHVHGYDRYIRLAGAGSGSTSFTADLPGIFEVETHDSGLLLLQLEVR